MSRRISFSELIREHQGKESQESAPVDLERRLIDCAPQLLKQCLDDNLTKTQKCYIMLYYTKNMNIVEIAKLYNVNKSTVSRTINRGRNRLLKAIKCEALYRSIRK